jgi:hypothetical protein
MNLSEFYTLIMIGFYTLIMIGFYTLIMIGCYLFSVIYLAILIFIGEQIYHFYNNIAEAMWR